MMAFFTMRLIILQVVCLCAMVVSASMNHNWLLPTTTRRQATTISTISSSKPSWGLSTYSRIHVRGGESNSSPPEEDEEDDDEEEDEEDDDEETSEESSNLNSMADIEIKVPDEEEWNDKDQAVEEAEADIEVMVEMEAEESDESDSHNNNEQPEPAVVVDPVAVADSATPMDDGDSSAFVDRMELADAYDEGELTSFEQEGTAADAPPAAAPETTTTAASEPEPQPEAAVEPQSSEPVQAVAEEESITPTAEPESASAPSVEPMAAPSSAEHTGTAGAEEQPANAAQEPPAEVASDSAPVEVPGTMTEAMKKSLRQLGYRRDDIARMKPSIAAVAIDKKLNRPVEGLPENWYLPGKKPRSDNRLTKVIAKIVLPILAAAVAVKGGMELDLASILSSSSSSNADSTETFRPLTAADMAYYSSIISDATGKKPSPKRQ